MIHKIFCWLSPLNVNHDIVPLITFETISNKITNKPLASLLSTNLSMRFDAIRRPYEI